MEAVAGLVTLCLIATGVVMPIMERFDDNRMRITFTKVEERMKAQIYYHSFLNEMRIGIDTTITLTQILSGNPSYPYLDRSLTFSVN